MQGGGIPIIIFLMNKLRLCVIFQLLIQPRIYRQVICGDIIGSSKQFVIQSCTAMINLLTPGGGRLHLLFINST